MSQNWNVQDFNIESNFAIIFQGTETHPNEILHQKMYKKQQSHSNTFRFYKQKYDSMKFGAQVLIKFLSFN